MKFGLGYAVGFVVGCLVGVTVAWLVIEAVGRSVTLPSKVQVPDFVPDALTVTT